MKTTNFSPLLSLFTVAPGLRTASGRTLSIYVPARAQGYDARYYGIVFGDLLHRYRERLGAHDLAVLVDELPRLREHIATVRPAGCAALAGFADQSTGLLELLKLPAATEERLEVGEPLLAPALRLIERYPPALVAVVDKERAKTFGFILDELRPLHEMTGGAVRHSRAGWTSAASNQRKADNRAAANLAVAADEVAGEMGSGAYQRVYVAGPQEARARFEHLVAHTLHERSVHLGGVSLDAAHLEAEIHKVLTALRASEH